ncbi:hypothetical protein H261_20754 [Paramagnetospirillum caucaseum]|uniref:Uncharacterized protein n=1 Tax=Paramagnetospirillum caucaseum TaxID=1244869 RepID=M2Y4G5_9PROT|nr:hypothetical protein [Paramagnetospirillum caucaseum]EME67986.1 hypothetical protein H261_20754 [Paramagnetospirillum caucaseum]
MTKTPISPTNANFSKFAVEPITRWLISAALNRRTITYGEAKVRLEEEFGFTKIFPTRMGHPAGMAMEQIAAKFPTAPLLNVLLVRKEDGMPGDGAGSFLATRFDVKKLGKKGARKKHPDLWRRHFDQAADEVYAYPDWEAVYDAIYSQKLTRDTPDSKGAEADGTVFGGGGEGKNHKALRLWVQSNPHIVCPRLKDVRAETEVSLYSGDRVDVVYFAPNATVGIEVKSKDSNWFDLQRGVYQCVKYRAVLAAQDGRESPNIQVFLVTETELDSDLQALAKRLGVKHAVHSVNVK